MSDQNQKNESIVEATADQRKKFEVLSAAITSDLATMSNKIATELSTLIAKQGGAIDLQEDNFKTLKNSLLNADPDAEKNKGRPVISLLATQGAALKNLDKLGVENVLPNEYKKLRESIDSVRMSLETSLSSEEGIKNLLMNQFETQASKRHPFMLSPKETDELSAKVSSAINFKDANAAALLGENMVLDKAIAPIMQDQMAKSFGKFNKDVGIYELDQSKLTPENIKEFGKTVSEKVKNYSMELPQAKAELKDRSEAISKAVSNISADVFKKCEDKKIKLTDGQKKEFVKSMEANFNSLGSEYVLDKQNNLSNAIVNRITNSRSITGRINSSTFTAEKINEITKKVADNQLSSSISDSTKKLNNMMMEKRYGDKEFNAKVETFVASNGLGNKDVSKMSNEDIAKLRLANSKHFDEIMGKGQASNGVLKKANLDVSKNNEIKIETNKATGLASEALSPNAKSNQTNDNLNKFKKDGNLTFLSSSQVYDDPSKGFLNSKAVIENESNVYHLGVKQQDVEKIYGQKRLSQTDSEKIPKFYRDSGGNIKDYDNARELKETIAQTTTALESMRSEFGNKYFPPAVRSQAEKLFSEKWPIITRNFDADDKKTKLSVASTKIVEDQDNEMKTCLDNISKDSSIDPSIRSNADKIINSSTPDNFREDVGAFIKDLPQGKGSKDLNELKTLHQESPNVRLKNFGGDKTSYMQVLSEVKGVRDSILELQKSLKKYDGPTLRYTTNLPIEGKNPTSQELSNGLTKTLFEQSKITGLDSSDKDFKNIITKMNKKEFSNITVEFENNGKVKSYKLEPDKLKEALLKVDKIPHSGKPYDQLTRSELKEVREAVGKQLEGMKIESVLKPAKGFKNKVSFKIKSNVQSKTSEVSSSKPTVTNNIVNDNSIVFPQEAKAVLQNLNASKEVQAQQPKAQDLQNAVDKKTSQSMTTASVSPKVDQPSKQEYRVQGQQSKVNDQVSKGAPEKKEPAKVTQPLTFLNNLVNYVKDKIAAITQKQDNKTNEFKDVIANGQSAGELNVVQRVDKDNKQNQVTVEGKGADDKKKVNSIDKKVLDAISTTTTRVSDNSKGFSPSPVTIGAHRKPTGPKPKDTHER